MNTDANSTSKIQNRQAFVDFINELSEDYRTNKNAWENKDLESFLEALAAYVEGSGAYKQHTESNANVDETSWKIFAEMFLGARIYE